MQYVFKLSGESPSLALAELEALFDIFKTNYKIKKKNLSENSVQVESDAGLDKILDLCARSAFIKKAYLSGSTVWEVSKGRFLEREPQKKPAFHPTTLKPKLARALVNLSRAKEGEVLLDPFCGAGSVLIEAAILGMKVIGGDFDEKMISYSKRNLDFYKAGYKNKKYKLIFGDATNLEHILESNSIGAIATDLPYGRSSRSSIKNLSELYKNFFASAYSVLKNKKYLVAMYPHYINAKKCINKKQWTLVSEGELYVHGSLTRKLLVLQKQ